MIDKINNIMFVECENLLLHEEVENYRLNKIVSLIVKDEVLKNAIITIQLPNKKYLIIDGAHRFSALKKIGCKWIPIQVFEPRDVTLMTWRHVVKVNEWYQNIDMNLFEISNSKLIGTEFRVTDFTDKTLAMPNDGMDLISYMKQWKSIVELYSSSVSVKRYSDEESILLDYDEVVIDFPKITIEEILIARKKNFLFFPGFTRFSIPGRLLNVNVPLSLLLTKYFDYERWEEIASKKELRYYAEPTYFFE
ncbi:ParB N-terminal domain-containing protein [Lysinibacillus xylanilyticus]|uniref:ParB N-terminal domain-containing protein n=1 Tax=Lysinibacillus xylanilyticus TaxID=582475 RepID=UPI00381325EA